MTSARAWLRAVAAIARRDLIVRASYRSMFVSRPLGMVFTLALFYYVSRLVSVAAFPTPDAYFAFVAVGVVIIGLMRASFDVPAALREELVGGSFERVELSPAGGTLAVVGMLVAPIVYAVGLAVFTLAAAALVFGIDVRWSTAALGLPLGLLGALALSPFALGFAAITLAFKQAPGQGAVLPALSLVSGLYFPVHLLPDWLRWLSDVQPLTPTVDLMRGVLLGTPAAGSAAVDLLTLAGFGAVGLPLAAMAVSAARAHSRRRGTLLES
jgi:ABC-2 type transport system permease protein